MKKKYFFLLVALLLSVCAFAQSKSTLKGDVNNDGIVDFADINAIIEIMKNGGGTVEESSYYWYIGQTDPSTMDEISPIVTDNSSPGWRKIGNTLSSYTANNPLWDGGAYPITTGSSRSTVYILLPNDILKVRDGDGNILDSFVSDGTKIINNVTYSFYVYKKDNLRTFIGTIF